MNSNKASNKDVSDALKGKNIHCWPSLSMSDLGAFCDRSNVKYDQVWAVLQSSYNTLSQDFLFWEFNRNHMVNNIGHYKAIDWSWY